MTSPARDRRTDVILAGLTAIVFILVAFISSLEYALEAAVTFGVFSAIIQQKWELRRYAWFWVTIGIFFIIHVAIATYVKIPDMRPGIIAVPIAIIDGLCMLAALSWIQRRKTTAV